MYQKRKSIENFLIMFIDISCLFCSFSIAFFLRYHTFFASDAGMSQMNVLGYVIVLDIIIELIRDGYRHFFRRGYWVEFKNVVITNVFLVLIFMAFLFVFHVSADVSRFVLGFAIAINVILQFIARIVFKRYMLRGYKGGRHSSKVILVTDVERALEVIREIELYNDWYHSLSGLILLDAVDSGDIVGGYRVVASKDDLMDYCIHNDVDEVMFISSKLYDFPQLENWLKQLVEMGVKVDFNIDIFDIDIIGKRSIDRIGKYAVASFVRNDFSNREMFLKRVLDICGSLVGMVFLAIATIFVAPAIKLDSPGPVFFGQTRVGKNGRKFTCYKFRSMYQDAEERKKELMKQNEVDGLMFKMKNDPRITKVGKFIRRTSIDELPQFWNILKGDMSLVGTRPPTVDEFQKYEAKHKCRLSMTPGLTGLWQISGRSDINNFEEVVILDMKYIDNWSIGLDVKILIKTVGAVLTGKGSH